MGRSVDVLIKLEDVTQLITSMGGISSRLIAGFVSRCESCYVSLHACAVANQNVP